MPLPSGMVGPNGFFQFKATLPSPAPAQAFWFRADLGTDTVVDGNPISTVLDQTNNGRNLTGAGTTRPLYKTNITNGLPVMRFDGVDDSLSTSAFAWAQPVTLFVTARYTSAFDPARRGLTDATAGSYTLNNYRNASTQMGMYDSGAGFGSSATTPENWHVYTFIHNSTLSQMWIDSVLSGTGDPGNPAISGFTVAGTENPAVDVGEIIGYTGVLSAVDQLAIETYLTRWISVGGTPVTVSMAGVLATAAGFANVPAKIIARVPITFANAVGTANVPAKLLAKLNNQVPGIANVVANNPAKLIARVVETVPSGTAIAAGSSIVENKIIVRVSPPTAIANASAMVPAPFATTVLGVPAIANATGIIPTIKARVTGVKSSALGVAIVETKITVRVLAATAIANASGIRPTDPTQSTAVYGVQKRPRNIKQDRETSLP